MLAAERAVHVNCKLCAGAVAAITGLLTTVLTVFQRVFLFVIFGAKLREQSRVSPLICAIKAGAGMRATVRAAL